MIDLSPFCGTDPFRPYLHQPFSVGEFTYATDGRLMVRIAKRPGVPPLSPESVLKNPDKALEGFEGAVFARLPAFEMPPKPPEEMECEACNGRGHEHDCPDCECTCMECDGSGNQATEARVSTLIGAVPYSLRYVRKMLALPDIELSDPLPEKPLLFRFADGVGALMPCSERYKTHVDIPALTSTHTTGD